MIEESCNIFGNIFRETVLIIMGSALLTSYLIVAMCLAIFDFYYGSKAFNKSEAIGKYLGYSAAAAGIVTVSYMISIWSDNYLQVSVASSVYFAGIDWMLVSLVHFEYHITDSQFLKSSSTVRRLIRGYALFDSIVLLINIFWEISVHYVRRDTQIAVYGYEMKPLYIMHLVFTYAMVVMILVILIRKAVKTPRQYRNQYLLNIAALLFVVFINAVFLFLDGDSPLMLIDHSVIGYSIALYLMYWAAFDYRYNDMLKALSLTIINNINQGIVLFDHTGKLIMNNEKAESILRTAKLSRGLTMSDFIASTGLPDDTDATDKLSLQFDPVGNRSVRCDYDRLRDNEGGIIGNLFVFTEPMNDVDLLTGFQRWERFDLLFEQDPSRFDHPTVAVTFDITGLGEINRTSGHEEGDKCIQKLARLLQKHMPQETFFIRGYEAHLIAVCVNYSESDIRRNVDEIINEGGGRVMFGMGMTVASDEDGRGGRNVIGAIKEASRSLHTKKLLSSDSARSQSLNSLVKALQESDSDTEAHVQRTQKMGAALGRRVGLCDSELADLSLLCLLHDIGKIGIPLEILNKPGKLTDDEWAVLRSHAEKGYQIAMSSDELKNIADMILSHHERWDGKGYPNRISGTDIPVLARFIAIVDAYDAMVNDRAYRKAISPEKAQAEIRRCAGTQFDPMLAEEFLRMLEENPEIAVGEKTGGGEVRLFENALENAPDNGNTRQVLYSRYILDLDDNIVEADNNFSEITGYAPAEAVGKLNQLDLIPSDDRAYYMVQVGEQFSKGNVAFLEHDILRRDGRRVRVLCIGKRYFDSALKLYRSEIIISAASYSSSSSKS